MEKRLVIAGTGSGVGKTTLTIGLMAALCKRGMQVQGFKCGPDYIDPTYHTAVTGRPSRNLDSWMLSQETLRAVYARGEQGADISIIEGVMGLYDGKNPLSDEGSTAEISSVIEAPIVLVVNCHSMARSAAAVVKGFQCLSDQVHIAAVIANKVGSEHHYRLVKEAIEAECGVPVIGYLKREMEIAIPERHLGLIPSIERGELKPLYDRLAELVEANIDVDQLLSLAERPRLEAVSSLFEKKVESADRVKLAVARDAAFHFYYPENLELLEAAGADLVFFSPLAGEGVPELADGLYLGGGFPEEFARELSTQEEVKRSIRACIRSGMPTVAECGGYMFLTEQLITTDGATYPMVGLIPGQVTMQPKLTALGYREIRPVSGHFLLCEGEAARGHEFHYSSYTTEMEITPAYHTSGMRGDKIDGYQDPTLQLSAGYAHIHFASAPYLPERWVAACRAYRVKRGVVVL